MKTLKNLKGAKELSKNEQKMVKGGYPAQPRCESKDECPIGNICVNHKCIPY